MDGHVFAYTTPRSTEQQAYTQARVAQLAAQRLERQRRSLELSNDPLAVTRSRSYSSATTSSTGKNKRDTVVNRTSKNHRREESGESMESTRLNGYASTVSLHSELNNSNQIPYDDPFELRHGRRYLRDQPYPLPCDLAELQRQNLRTLLGCRVFGKPFCFPNIDNAVPKKILEVGCGSGYWSAMAHEYLSSLGHKNVSFTGLDVAPLASDLKRQGVNWRFVQHDIHRTPWPFEDGEFDLVMLRDLSLAIPMTESPSRHLDENIRVLREGGTLEIWESDLIIRSLLPQSLSPANNAPPTQEQEIAEKTATFPMTTGAPFAPAHNKFLVQANSWIAEALDRRKFSPVPCARIAQLLIQEPELSSIGARRVAIPLGELRWEREGAAGRLQRMGSQASVVDSAVSMKGKKAGKARKVSSFSSLSSTYSSSSSTESVDQLPPPPPLAPQQQQQAQQQTLTPDQLALRRTALITVLQTIESFEPLLREVSGKNTDEWSTWSSSMAAELTDPAKANMAGECLELGVWWATKISEEDPGF